MKRCYNLPNAGILINRIHGDSVKDKLVKDIYTLYSFGEGNSKALPKSLLKAPEVAQTSAQTDIESKQTSLLKSLVEKNTVLAPRNLQLYTQLRLLEFEVFQNCTSPLYVLD